MASLPQMKTIARFTDHGWSPVDIHYDIPLERRAVGGPAIYSNGRGGLVQINPDGTHDSLLPDGHAPMPMFPDTPRGGVIGYMCKIDFECELGGTSTMVRTKAVDAICCGGTCGVVEVEVIGRAIVLEENFTEELDEQDHALYKVEAMKKLEDWDNARLANYGDGEGTESVGGDPDEQPRSSGMAKDGPSEG